MKSASTLARSGVRAPRQRQRGPTWSSQLHPGHQSASQPTPGRGSTWRTRKTVQTRDQVSQTRAKKYVHNVGLSTSSLAGLVLCMSANAHAKDAPAALRGNSVVASWVENREQRIDGEREFSTQSYPMQLEVYISSSGRAFARRIVVDKRAIGSQASVGPQTKGQTSQFIEGTLRVFTNMGNGAARMMLIDFDPSFKSCQIKVQLGSQRPGSIINTTSTIVPGLRVQIRSTVISNESCSIRTGNVFSQ